MLDLLAHGGAPGQLLFGLPRRCDLERDPVLDRRQRTRIERVLQETIDEVPRQALLLLQHRAPHGLGRVRGEDGLDDDQGQRFLQFLERRAPPVELLERRAQARGLGRVRTLVVDAPPHPMDLLGGVDHAEVSPERAHDLECALRRQLLQARGKLRARLGIPLAPKPRRHPRRLDGLVQPRGRELTQKLAEQRPEPSHIAPQRMVLRGKVDGLRPDLRVGHGALSCACGGCLARLAIPGWGWQCPGRPAVGDSATPNGCVQRPPIAVRRSEGLGHLRGAGPTEPHDKTPKHGKA